MLIRDCSKELVLTCLEHVFVFGEVESKHGDWDYSLVQFITEGTNINLLAEFL